MVFQYFKSAMFEIMLCSKFYEMKGQPKLANKDKYLQDVLKIN